MLRDLHGSFLGVMRAELQALSDDVSRSGKQFALALLFWFFAAGLALFALGALAFAGIAGLAAVMPAWAAGLVIAGVLLLLAGLCAWYAGQRMEEVEGPTSAARRRLEEHVAWWDRRVAARAAVRADDAPLPDESDEGSKRQRARRVEWDTDPELDDQL